MKFNQRFSYSVLVNLLIHKSCSSQNVNDFFFFFSTDSKHPLALAVLDRRQRFEQLQHRAGRPGVGMVRWKRIQLHQLG